MSSFDRMATVTASTKRSPAISGGKRGAKTTNIASLSCTPLDPVDPEVRARMGLDGPHEVLQTFTHGGLDIREGDVLVVNSEEYPIRAVGEWEWKGTEYKHIIIEELKRGD